MRFGVAIVTRQLASTERRPVRTPVVRQLSPPECGAAALASVLRFFGKPVDIADVRQSCGVNRDGASALALVKCARRYGLDARGFRYTVEQALAVPAPSIAHFGFGHYVVIEGRRADRVYVNDPFRGRITMSVSDFTRRFSGVVLVFEMPGDRTARRAHRRRPRGLFRFGWPGFAMAGILGFACCLLATLALSAAWHGASASFDLPLGIGQFGIPMAVALALFALCAVLFVWRLSDADHGFAEREALSALDRALRRPLRELEIRPAALITAAVSPAALANAFGVGMWHRVAAIYTPLLALPLCVIDSLAAAIWAFCAFVLFVVCYEAPNRLYESVAADGRENRIWLTRLSLKAALAFDSAATRAPSSAFLDALTERFRRAVADEANLVRLEGWRVLGVAGCAVFVVAGMVLLTLGGLVELDVAVGFLIAASCLGTATALSYRGIPRSADLSGSLAIARGLAAGADSRDDGEPSMQPVPSSDRDNAQQRKLRFRDVTFGHNQEAPPLLRGISMDVAPGSLIAVTGASGCGKTALGKLAAGLYQPWAGSVGLDLEPSLQARLTGGLAYVEQEPVLTEGTIESNIRFWRDDLAREAVKRAVDDACLTRVVESRVCGLSAAVGRAGTPLSRGERQRVDLARALAGDPAILILDEPFSSIDDETETSIIAALRRRGVACLLLTQRWRSIERCDHVLVLANGTIAEHGSPDVLIQQGGAFSKLFAETRHDGR